MNDRLVTIEEAVEAERELIASAKEKADIVFDTTSLSAIQCRVRIADMFSIVKKDIMTVQCMSFGYKYGIPNDADLVFDVRCLPNPFYIEKLKHKTGLDDDVYNYVMNFEESKILAEKLFSVIDYLIPLYKKEGRSQLVIAFGCTGGHHRSVTFARVIHTHLQSIDCNVILSHRDILK